MIADERWAESLDHKVVVVKSCDDDLGRSAANWGGDVGSRHFEELILFGWSIVYRELGDSSSSVTCLCKSNLFRC
jgi:hypothetical protein